MRAKLDTLKKLAGKLHFGIRREKFLKLAPAVIAVILVAGILSGLVITTVSSLYQTSSTISSVGTFKAIGIGVYWDDQATSRVDTLDWGFIAAGSQKSFTVYVKNEGALPLTLSISASNWDPQAASNFLTLNWNYNGQKVTAGTTLPVVITLTVSDGVNGVDVFNFDVTAVGTYAA
jgi:hypothetical protein